MLSGEVMRCNLSDVDAKYKHYRYQWLLKNGNENIGGAYGYGQRDAVLNVFDEQISPEQIIL